MSTALTVAEVQLPETIVHASASCAEIQDFIARHPFKTLSKLQSHQVRYAYARAVYRGGHDLTVEQLALLCETNVERVLRYARRLKVAVGEMVQNNAASRIMCNMMED